MTDGTSQGLFIVVAIVIFGIFVVLAYILFEDTLSPAMASMFSEAIEQAGERLDSHSVGDNLLTNSGGDTFTNGSSVKDDRIESIDGKNALVFNNKLDSANFFNDYELIPGETYTFSFKAKATKHTTIKEVFVNRMNYGFLRNQQISTKWETYYFTFVAVNNNKKIDELDAGSDNLKGPNHTYIHMYPQLGNTDAKEHEFYLTELKLEFGDRATKWIK